MNFTRREIIANSTSLAMGLAASLAPEAQAQPFEKSPRLKIVVCGGHPGDPEYGCGGTIARLTASGHDVTLLYMNEGDWPPTPAPVRLAEAQEACEILKAKRLYAGQLNGHAIVDAGHYDQYRKLLEIEKPHAVFTHWPLDNHRDHRACSNLTYDSWLKMDKAFSLYYYEVSNGEDTQQFSPGYYVDIGAFEAVKRAACYAHASQTPDRYYQLQDSVASFRGLESGCKRAEAFLLQRGGQGDVLSVALKGCGALNSGGGPVEIEKPVRGGQGMLVSGAGLSPPGEFWGLAGRQFLSRFEACARRSWRRSGWHRGGFAPGEGRAGESRARR